MLLPPCSIGDFSSDDFFSSGVLGGGGMYHHDVVPQQPEDLLLCTDERLFNNDRTPPDQDYQHFALPSSTASSCLSTSQSTDSLHTASTFASQQQMIEGLDSRNDSCSSLQDNPDVDRSNDLQWLVTTSNTEQSVSAPNSVSSTPPSSFPAMYPADEQPKSEEQAGSSVATITHTAFSPGQFVPTAESAVETKPLVTPKRRVAGTRTSTKSSSGTTMKPKGTPGRKRKVPDHALTPAEANKRHIRRERNKIAAAKCRNRRRELTDRLQGQTDQLEEELHQLNMEVQALLQEKDRLEFILAAHAPQCKAGINDNAPINRTVSSHIRTMDVNPDLSIHDSYPSTATMSYPRLEPPARLDLINQQRVMAIGTNSPSPSTPIKLLYPPPTPVALGTPRPRYLPVGPSVPFNTRPDQPLNTPVCSLITPSTSHPHESYGFTPGSSMKISPMSNPFMERGFPTPGRHHTPEGEFSPPMNMSSSSVNDRTAYTLPMTTPQRTRSRDNQGHSPKLLTNL